MKLRDKVLQLDFIGTVLVLASVICFTLSMQYGGQSHPWSSSEVIGLIVGFVVCLIALGIWEMFQGERAMIPLRLLQRHIIVCAAGFFFFGSYMAMIYYLPIYFQSISGVSAMTSGVRNLPFIVAVSIFTVVSGSAITVWGLPAPFLVAGAIIGTIGAGLIYTFDISTSASKWIGYQILAGIGNGLGVQVPMIIAQANSAPADLATTTAIMMCKNHYHLYLSTRTLIICA